MEGWGYSPTFGRGLGGGGGGGEEVQRCGGVEVRRNGGVGSGVFHNT